MKATQGFPEARRALGDLAERAPDARALTLMAAIERGEGASDAVVQGWLTRALSAPRGPQWVCDNCNHIHSEWVPVCENCTSFDTLSWRRPETPEIASATGAHMLPLLRGAPVATTAPEEVAEAELITADARVSDDDQNAPAPDHGPAAEDEDTPKAGGNIDKP